jgi:hypothetical protein
LRRISSRSGDEKDLNASEPDAESGSDSGDSSDSSDSDESDIEEIEPKEIPDILSEAMYDFDTREELDDWV